MLAVDLNLNSNQIKETKILISERTYSLKVVFSKIAAQHTWHWER